MGRAPKTKPSGYHNLLANFPHSAQSLSTAQLFASWWVRSNCKGIQPAANWHSFTCGWSPPSFVQSHFLQLSLQIPGSNSTVKSQSPNRREKKHWFCFAFLILSHGRRHIVISGVSPDMVPTARCLSFTSRNKHTNGSNREAHWILLELLEPPRQLGCPETSLTPNPRCVTSKKGRRSHFEPLQYTKITHIECQWMYNLDLKVPPLSRRHLRSTGGNSL